VLEAEQASHLLQYSEKYEHSGVTYRRIGESITKSQLVAEKTTHSQLLSSVQYNTTVKVLIPTARISNKSLK